MNKEILFLNVSKMKLVKYIITFIFYYFIFILKLFILIDKINLVKNIYLIL